MIVRYEIVKDNKEERLILYLDYNFEFARIGKNEKKSLEDKIIKYIKDNKIIFNGTTITLIVGGIIAGNIYLNPITIENTKIEYNKPQIEEKDTIKNIEDKDSNKIEKQEKSSSEAEVSTEDNNSKDVETNNKVNNSNNNTNNTNTPINDNSITNIEIPKDVDTNTYINIRRSNGEYLTLELEEYIIGVVGYEMPASFNEEALKSQAVIARTYALKSLSRGITLTDNNTTQGYKSNTELQSMWGGSYNTYYNKVRNAVQSTKGEYLSFNGEYIDAVYHSTSNGKTESSVNVWGNYYPYLVSVDSLYDTCNPSFQKDSFITYQEISTRLGISIDSNTNFNILSYTSGNRIDSIEINNQILTGIELRNKLGLRSADIEILKNDNGIIFRTRGYGHGVGLSQYGANGYANNGYSYKDILRHYYTGVMISKM